MTVKKNYQRSQANVSESIHSFFVLTTGIQFLLAHFFCISESLQYIGTNDSVLLKAKHYSSNSAMFPRIITEHALHNKTIQLDWTV